MADTIDCTAVAKGYEQILTQKNQKHPHTLATFLTSNDAWSRKYQDFLDADCKRYGIRHQSVQCTTDLDLCQKVQQHNYDPGIDGILIFYPLGESITVDKYKLANWIYPKKDVEGLHRNNLGRLLQEQDDETPVPSTAQAVVDVLKYHKIPFKGKTGLIMNRSDIVGKPLRHLFESLDMTVMAAYHNTDTQVVDSVLPHADIIVTAVPDPAYRLPSAQVKKGAIVIAVNPSNIDDTTLEHCSLVTRRDNPLGRVTRKITLLNLYKCRASRVMF